MIKTKIILITQKSKMCILTLKKKKYALILKYKISNVQNKTYKIITSYAIL